MTVLLGTPSPTWHRNGKRRRRSNRICRLPWQKLKMITRTGTPQGFKVANDPRRRLAIFKMAGSETQRMCASSAQLADRFARAEDGDRAAAEVAEFVTRVDGEVAVDGGEQVLRGEGAFFGEFGTGVGGADGLGHAQSAAAHQGGVGLRPVVAAELAAVARQPRR